MKVINFIRQYSIILLLYFGIAEAFDNSLVEKVDRIVKKRGDINYGILVKDLESNDVELEIHPNRLFTPASVTKLFTSFFAIQRLGEEYSFITSMYIDSKETNSTDLVGNIYLRFTGDPSLTDQDLFSILDILKKKGIKKIDGNIIIDDSYFDNKWTSPGGFTWDDKVFGSYASPKHTIVINENRAEAVQKPKIAGRNADLEYTKESGLQVKNSVKVVKKLSASCPYKSEYLGDNTFHLFGCLEESTKTVKLNFALPETRKMIVAYIENYLRSNKISFTGKFEFGKSKGDLVVSHRSTPLKNMLSEIIKESNNLYSAAIFKAVAAKYTGKPGSDEDGKKLFEDFLSEKRFNKKYIRIYDGSGESRYNLISPSELSRLLSKIYKTKNQFDLFYKSMPIHSEDGTLKYRRKIKDISSKIRAKTGSMNGSGTSTIAGYYFGKKKYSFVLMINNHNLSYPEAKDLEDEILQKVFSTK